MNYKRIEWHDKAIENRFDGEIKKLYAYETMDGEYLIRPALRTKLYKTKSPKDVKVFVVQKKGSRSILCRVFNENTYTECTFETLAHAKRVVEKLQERLENGYEFK